MLYAIEGDWKGWREPCQSICCLNLHSHALSFPRLLICSGQALQIGAKSAGKEREALDFVLVTGFRMT